MRQESDLWSSCSTLSPQKSSEKADWGILPCCVSIVLTCSTAEDQQGRDRAVLVGLRGFGGEFCFYLELAAGHYGVSGLLSPANSFTACRVRPTLP